jgi:hypothetical protein
MGYKLVECGKHGHITLSRKPVCIKVSKTEYLNKKTGEIIEAQKRGRLARNANRAKQNCLDIINLNASAAISPNARFLTLTTQIPKENKKVFLDCLEKFKRSKIYRDLLGTKYTFVLEPQDRGAIHCHLIAYNAKPWINKIELAELHGKWKEIIGGKGAIYLEKIKLDTSENVGAYLAKYIYKGFLEGLFDGKFVIHSHGLKRPIPKQINRNDVERISREKRAIKRDYKITLETGYELELTKWYW